tara:strand:- start:373 stop:1287 length:915 start_codon:yes stop_codon:yes gene_type:complete
MINLPKGVDLNDLLQFLRNIGLQSASMLRSFENELLPLYDSFENLHLNQKNYEPVTAADEALNNFIINEFNTSYPNIDWDIVTEENAKLITYKKSKSDWIWFVDPLDGTKDFIQNTGEYAVHIALIFKNAPILSMVLLPSLKEIWFGIEGFGTWQEKENDFLDNKKVPLANRDYKNFAKRKATKVLTSKNHNNQKLDLILKELKIQNIIRMGSIGFKVCALLRNEADIYISISDKTSPKDWDLAAPHALIKSAKCHFTYVSGDELNYDAENYEQRGCLIASTLVGGEHFYICKRISSIIKKHNL